MTVRLLSRRSAKHPSPVEVAREVAFARLLGLGFTPVQAGVLAAAGMDVVGYVRVDRMMGDGRG